MRLLALSRACSRRPRSIQSASMKDQLPSQSHTRGRISYRCHSATSSASTTGRLKRLLPKRSSSSSSAIKPSLFWVALMARRSAQEMGTAIDESGLGNCLIGGRAGWMKRRGRRARNHAGAQKPSRSMVCRNRVLKQNRRHGRRRAPDHLLSSSPDKQCAVLVCRASSCVPGACECSRYGCFPIPWSIICQTTRELVDAQMSYAM